MNVEGNKVIWNKGNIAVVDTRRGFVVYKQVTSDNGDGTAFRRWSQEAFYDDLDAAISFAKTM